MGIGRMNPAKNREEGGLIDPLPEPLTKRYWQWYDYQGLPLSERWSKEITVESLARKCWLQQNPGDPKSSHDYRERMVLPPCSHWGTHQFVDGLLFWPSPPICVWCEQQAWTEMQLGSRRNKPEKVMLPHLCTSRCESCGEDTPRLYLSLSAAKIAACMRTGEPMTKEVCVCPKCGCEMQQKVT